jgi:hypothetical protein
MTSIKLETALKKGLHLMEKGVWHLYNDYDDDYGEYQDVLIFLSEVLTLKHIYLDDEGQQVIKTGIYPHGKPDKGTGIAFSY